jgi:dihydrofolate synthase/folylpolyglutamate synthase
LAIGEDRFAGLTCPLPGKFQVKNAAAAVTAAWRLRAGGLTIPRRSIFQGLWEASWPGRLERIASKPLVLLDGGHNPSAAREIATFIREELPGRRLRLVYGSMRDKAIREICEALFPLAAEVYLTHPEHVRAATTAEILAALSSRLATGQNGTGPTLYHYDTGQVTLHVEPEPVRALEEALNASSAEDVVLVVGSLFLVGAIKKAQREGKLKL